MAKKLTEVVCLVFWKNKKLLLEQRLDQDNFFKHWTFTGGKVEEVDKLEENHILRSSIREADEETGFIPSEIEVFCQFNATSKSGKRFKFYGVWVKNFGGKLDNKESDRRLLKWVDIEEAKRLIQDNKVDEKVLKDFLLKVYINEMGDPSAGVSIRKS